ncbi:diadenylate cyclase CdaA [Vagococcus coleopterorum]|uniref:diadenylate cyclase CdaA n=1 Tax=Vagococcus coleopterorum TaxID=2714946 RepID=UPI0023B128EE|nr:diadenylate cyclase CdaA [Vagococcus coleopterorum]
MLDTFFSLFKIETWQDIWHSFILTPNFFINLLDILVVWFVLYKLFNLLRGTKAVQLLKGIAVIIIVRLLSRVLGLNTVSWLMDQVITYGVIAAVVIFQPEVRRGLEHLGRVGFLKKSGKAERKDIALVKAYDQAIQYMSKRKIGALITIERNTGLDEYIETGIPLDAEISSELLINIFIPNTPLHDGAVIVNDDKIAVACAYLPLSESETIPKEFGTRHRAAIGVSEVSDALTIIVSEETGDVSITMDNHFYPHLEQEEYYKILEDAFVNHDEKPKESLVQSFLEGFTKGGQR